MTRFQVDSEAVLSTTGAARASIDRIQTEVNGLLGQLVSLQESWSGAAATAFQGVVSDWRATQVRVEQNMTAINQALAAVGHSYAETELDNARVFAR